MKKILFVCHGNICRSPMAEFVMKELVKKAGLENDFYIKSAATSTEEIGNDIHRGTKTVLQKNNIAFERRQARRITVSDYDDFDFLIGMDEENLYYMNKVWNNDPHGKISLLMEFAGENREVADPWYTGNFEKTYLDVVAGCKGLLATCLKN